MSIKNLEELFQQAAFFCRKRKKRNGILPCTDYDKKRFGFTFGLFFSDKIIFDF
jgi:hypothetical protein